MDIDEALALLAESFRIPSPPATAENADNTYFQQAIDAIGYYNNWTDGFRSHVGKLDPAEADVDESDDSYSWS